MLPTLRQFSDKKHITISWDQTAGGNFGKERLLALRKAPDLVKQEDLPNTSVSFNHSLQDYQMQLMLLEQQNKKRLLIARQEADSELPLLDSGFLRSEAQIHIETSSDSKEKKGMVAVLAGEGLDFAMNASSGLKNGASNPEATDKLPELLSVSPGSDETLEMTDLVQALRKRISELEGKPSGSGPSTSFHSESLSWKLFYRIGSDPVTYLGEPFWSIGPKRKLILKGDAPIGDLNSWLKYNNQIPFIVVRNFHPNPPEVTSDEAAEGHTTLVPPKVSSETIMFISAEMKAAVQDFIQCQAEVADGFLDSDLQKGIAHAPYLFWYHHRSFSQWDLLAPNHRILMEELTKWMARTMKSSMLKQMLYS